MLLKRLDVTLQSFQWGQTRGNEAEMAAAVEAKRRLMNEEPTDYTVTFHLWHYIGYGSDSDCHN